MSEARATAGWSLVCHLTANGQGRLTVSRPGDRGIRSTTITAADKSGSTPPPMFLGVTGEDRVILLESASKTIQVRDALPRDAFPAYAYRAPDGAHVWFMNDGDEETGCDALNCGDTGSSVTVIRNTGNTDRPAEFIKTICVGRGHHVTTFTAPSAAASRVPKRAFVSNLKDGSISVLGNDPGDAGSYLKITATINLHDPQRDKDAAAGIPNNAFPHGKVYSPVTGKLYSLNNGYGTVYVIDPAANTIEQTVPLPVSSNLLLSPDGRFIIGKGADRKTDPDHVLGRLTVIDVTAGRVVENIDLPDFYPSVYRFNHDGSKLYVTSAATGKGVQRDNLKTRSVLIFDATGLPSLALHKEVAVGLADCGRRPIAFTRDAGLVFIPNPTDGTVTALDGRSDAVVETFTVAQDPVDEVNFSFWDGTTSGA
jgi:DNA-binding beta-propeller fold protein YncE